MCSPNNERDISVHAAERFVRWRLKIPEGQLNYFKSPEDIVAISQRINMAAQENFLKSLLGQGRIDEALLAFDRFFEENKLLCLSTISILILALCSFEETVELSGPAELFLKSERTLNPKLELDVRYLRYDSVVFVTTPKRVITCFTLRPDQQDILDSLMYGKMIQPF